MSRQAFREKAQDIGFVKVCIYREKEWERRKRGKEVRTLTGDSTAERAYEGRAVVREVFER
jgi:hypothetical protein